VVLGGGSGAKPLKTEHICLFSRVRWWRCQTATALENKHSRSFSRVVGGAKQQPPSKTSTRARFRGWWKCQTTTTLENEHLRSFSRVVEGGGGAKQQPPSKTSTCARFRGWWEVVEVPNINRPQKRVLALVFEGGKRWWGVPNSNRPRKRPYVVVFEVMGGGGDGKQQLPSKTSVFSFSRAIIP